MKIYTFTFLLFIINLTYSNDRSIPPVDEKLSQLNPEERTIFLLEQAEKNWSKNANLSLSYSKKALENAKNENDLNLTAKSYNYIGISYDELGKLDSALINFNFAKDLLDRTSNKKALAKTYNNIGIAYYNQFNYEKALENYKISYEINKYIKDTVETIKVLDNIAYLHKKIQEYEKALEYYFELQKLCEVTNNKKSLYKNYNHIAAIYWSMEDFDNAKFYFRRTLELSKNIDDDNAITRAYSNLGMVYHENNQYDSSIVFHNNALNLAKVNQNLSAQAIILNNLALVYKTKGNYEKALEISKQAYSLYENKEQDKIFYPVTTIAEILIKQKDFNEALKYLREADLIIQNNENINFNKILYKLYSDYYLNTNSYKNSLEYYKLYSSIKDSLNLLENNEKLSELQVKYETAKKETENKLLREKNEIQERNNRRQLILFTIISALTIFGVVLLLSRYREKVKNNRKLKEKNIQIEKQHNELEVTYNKLKESEENLIEANATKDKFFSIIAHDLKNPLQAITLSSDLLLNEFMRMDGEQLVELINNISKSGKLINDLLENLLLWSRSQTQRIDFNPAIFDLYAIVLENFKLLESIAKQKEINLSHELKLGIYAYGDFNMINTVVRNLVSNAIKFTNPRGEINVKVERHEERNEYQVCIIDDGIGISKDNLKKLFRLDIHHTTVGTNKELGTGLGLILCKEFIEKNNGTISVKSELGKGTTFKFTLPIAEQ